MIKEITLKRLNLLLVLFFLSGCSTTKDTKIPSQQLAHLAPTIDKRDEFLEKVAVFRDLRQIDLDEDGREEMVAVYTSVDNATCVRVFRINNNRQELIFKETFATPDVSFHIQNGVPLLVYKEYDASLRRRLNKIYHWTGERFTLK